MLLPNLCTPLLGRLAVLDKDKTDSKLFVDIVVWWRFNALAKQRWTR